MPLLDFNKPNKLQPTKDHNQDNMSDSGIDGTYVPNMSHADRLKWKAKHIKGKDERIEIRTEEPGVNLLVIVYKKPRFHYQNKYHEQTHQIRMSMNGTSVWTMNQWKDLETAVQEAKEILSGLNYPYNLSQVK